MFPFKAPSGVFPGDTLLNPSLRKFGGCIRTSIGLLEEDRPLPNLQASATRHIPTSAPHPITRRFHRALMLKRQNTGDDLLIKAMGAMAAVALPETV